MQILLIYVFTSDFKVVEVAHDHQKLVMKYITDDLKLINSYDRWHGKVEHLHTVQTFRYLFCAYIIGTKNVAKMMKGISCGLKKLKGRLGFWSSPTNVTFDHDAVFAGSVYNAR